MKSKVFELSVMQSNEVVTSSKWADQTSHKSRQTKSSTNRKPPFVDLRRLLLLIWSLTLEGGGGVVGFAPWAFIVLWYVVS